MELFRRLPTGRLADIVNKSLVEDVGLLDGLIATASSERAKNSTRMGEPGEAVIVDEADPKTRALLEAYAVGVNQWIDDVRNGVEGAIWPAEFNSIVLSYTPEDVPPWTPEDSIATVLTLVGNLTLGERAHTQRAAARDAINDNDRYLDLWSLEPLQKSPVLAEGTYPPPPATEASTKALKKPLRCAFGRRVPWLAWIRNLPQPRNFDAFGLAPS